MRRRATFAGLTLFAILTAGAPVSAEPPGRVGIIAVDLGGDAPPELRTQLERKLRQGLESAGAEVIPLADVRETLDAVPELAGCRSTACMERLGELLGAQAFIRGEVEAAGADYRAALELLTAEAEGAVARRLEQSCTVCTISEVNDLVGELGGEILREPERPQVVVETDPPGAELVIDGEPAGASPATAELAPGPHSVAATAEGYLPARQVIEVERASGEPQRFQLSLARRPDGERDRSERRGGRPFRVWKWAAAGGSLAALTLGAVLIGIDGAPTCDRPSPLQQCLKVRNTMAGGVVSVLAGVGLGGLSGWMFWRDQQSAREARAGVTPTEGGAVGSVRLRF